MSLRTRNHDGPFESMVELRDFLETDQVIEDPYRLDRAIGAWRPRPGESIEPLLSMLQFRLHGPSELYLYPQDYDANGLAEVVLRSLATSSNDLVSENALWDSILSLRKGPFVDIPRKDIASIVVKALLDAQIGPDEIRRNRNRKVVYQALLPALQYDESQLDDSAKKLIRQDSRGNNIVRAGSKRDLKRGTPIDDMFESHYPATKKSLIGRR